jgi:hypothetical protein
MIYNNLFIGNEAGVQITLSGLNWYLANNIFWENVRGIYANNGSSGTTRTLDEYLPVFSSDFNLFFQNENDYFIRPDVSVR